MPPLFFWLLVHGGAAREIYLIHLSLARTMIPLHLSEIDTFVRSKRGGTRLMPGKMHVDGLIILIIEIGYGNQS